MGRDLALIAGMRNDSLVLGSLTERVIGCAITVHKATGPGLLESVYKTCLVIELRARGLEVATECNLPLFYKGCQLEVGYRADMIVDKAVVVEVKAVDTLAPVHQAQVITYLKLTGCPVGLLFNFNVPVLRHGIRRVEPRAMGDGTERQTDVEKESPWEGV
jgi:GxxExxY protein